MRANKKHPCASFRKATEARGKHAADGSTVEYPDGRSLTEPFETRPDPVARGSLFGSGSPNCTELADLDPHLSNVQAMRLARQALRERFQFSATRPRITVLLPAKNEALNLPWVLQRMPSGLHEVLLVDGDSTDNTVAVAREHYPGIQVVTQRAPGKGAALVTGMLAASGDIIVMIDADGSMDPIEIHGLVGALLSGADVVKGSRYVAGGGSQDLSMVRNLGNKGLNLASQLLFGHHWTELCYGLAAFWADVIPQLGLDQILDQGDPGDSTRYGRGFEIETLLFTRSHKLGLTVAEVPSFEYRRRFGESNLQTFRDGKRVLHSMFHERVTPNTAHLGSASGPVMLVGAGTAFLSGISHYTHHVALALQRERVPVSVLLMRKLVPRVLYPGRDRVGDESLSTIVYPDEVPVFDGIDWDSPESLRHAKAFIRKQRPRVIVFQWWTAAVAAQYLVLAREARKVGARVVIEFHEVQDVGEANIPFASISARALMMGLLSQASAVIVHSSQDAEAIAEHYRIPAAVPIQVIPHGPFDTLVQAPSQAKSRASSEQLKLLFFGVIRPYKGLDDLLAAFQMMLRANEDVSLTVVGESWNPNDPIVEELRTLAEQGKVTIDVRYVPDEDVGGLLAAADVLVLPYRRCSASGPLALAMAAGMPVVTTDLQSLMQVTEGYTGAVHVPPRNPQALVSGIHRAEALVGQLHRNPLSWSGIIALYEALFKRIGALTAPIREPDQGTGVA